MDLAMTSSEKRRCNGELLRFTYPAVFEQFLLRISSLAGAAFLGHVGAKELSASSLSSTLMTIVEALLMGIALGITVLCARFISNRQRFDRLASAGLAVEMAASLLLLAVLSLIGSDIIGLLFSEAEGTVLIYTKNYFSISILACPFMALNYACSSLMRACGDSRTPFVITLLSNGLNLVGIYFCLNTLGYDYRSVAVCYCISTGINGILKLAAVISGKYKPLTLRLCPFDMSDIRLLAKIAIPSMLERFFIQFAFLGIQMVTTQLGTVVLAGYQAANNVINFVYTVTGGFETAIVPMVGRYKFENKSKAKQIVKGSYLYTYIFTFAMGAVLFIFAEQFVSIFAREKDVIHEAANILRLFILTIPLTTAFQAGGGVLKTGSDIKYSLIITVIAPNFIRVPLAYFLVSQMNMGFIGLYIGCVCDYTMRAAVVIWRVLRKKWLDD